MRWHPRMIKWCLNIKLHSSAAYEAIRESGFISLPSSRTLRDYTSRGRAKEEQVSETSQFK